MMKQPQLLRLLWLDHFERLCAVFGCAISFESASV
jgi:hypothetical protein